MTTDDLTLTQEVFISSTTREVAGVGFVNPNWEYACPGKQTLALEQAFKAHVEEYLAHAGAR